MTIQVSKTLGFPDVAVTETFGFLAMRGAGKSNAVVVMAEEMYRLGLPWVAVDPKGDWWGIRSNAKGNGPGLPIPIFGGLHGDLPLEPEAGAFIADLIVRENLTCVLDVSEFASKAKQARFLADFADRLYRNHGKNPQPRHIFAEEADEYIPQMVRADMARCVGAWERLVKRGRQRGLGVSLVSQRSASINKDVLTQILTLIVLRTTSPQDRKAIMGWVEYHSAAKQIVDDVPTLNSGEAWVFSPQWLGKTERVTFNRRTTFDSGGTPVMGKTRAVATLADIDLKSLSSELAEMAERAVADDPAILKARIKSLEAQLAKKPEPIITVEHLRVPFVPKLVVESVEDLEDGALMLTNLIKDMKKALDVESIDLPKEVIAAPSRPVESRPAVKSEPKRVSVEGVKLGLCEKAILSVLAQFPEGRTAQQVSTLSGYSIKSSGFGNSLGRLRSFEYISPARINPITITGEGLSAIDGQYETLPTGRALLAHWLGKLGKAERTFLEILVEVWPRSLSKEELSERSGYSITSSGFGNALGKLRTLELINRGADIRADDVLAQEAKS